MAIKSLAKTPFQRKNMLQGRKMEKSINYQNPST